MEFRCETLASTQRAAGSAPTNGPWRTIQGPTDLETLVINGPVPPTTAASIRVETSFDGGITSRVHPSRAAGRGGETVYYLRGAVGVADGTHFRVVAFGNQGQAVTVSGVATGTASVL